MLGLIDKYYSLRKCRNGYSEPKANWTPEITSFDQSKTTWFCFVPSIVSKVSLIRRGLIPKEGNVFVYTISSFDLITRNTAETVEKLSDVYADALEKMHTAIKQGNSISLLGVSLGNVISIRLASQAQTKIKNLVSIVGGGGIWDYLVGIVFSLGILPDSLDVFRP